MLLAYEEKEQARKAGCIGHFIAEADLGNRSNKHRHSSNYPSQAVQGTELFWLQHAAWLI